VKGRERLEQAVYTRKRLRAEHRWMNRYWELKGEPYNFNDAELAAIMAHHPGQPAGYRNKADGEEVNNKHH
jgi:hypothetical protein